MQPTSNKQQKILLRQIILRALHHAECAPGFPDLINVPMNIIG
ncbi:MAG TPA: hypothetical protein VFD09_03395 [Thiopseudomonas sp.]|nr:hypothetical protein [Thiopseudomonas sp.]